MLELRHVVKQYHAQQRAVDDVSLSLQGGVVGLIGHNGAGKTSLMQMIATLTKPSSGEILFHGQDIVKKPASIRSRLGYLPQDFGVYPNLSALELMHYFAALQGVRDTARIRQLLELVNLSEHAHRNAAAFSGGMRRRLGIAQALLNQPEILIVDEPTAGLDPEERLRFRNLLAELGQSRLVIMSTHIVSDVESIASEIAILRQGRLVTWATPDTIIAAARGKIWLGQVNLAEYDYVKTRVRVLHTQRQGATIQVRVAHHEQPFANASLAEPGLEDALMAQRYSAQEMCDA